MANNDKDYTINNNRIVPLYTGEWVKHQSDVNIFDESKFRAPMHFFKFRNYTIERIRRKYKEPDARLSSRRN